MKFVSAVDAKMMMRIAPTIAIASRLVVHITLKLTILRMNTSSTTT